MITPRAPTGSEQLNVIPMAQGARGYLEYLRCLTNGVFSLVVFGHKSYLPT